MRERPRAVALLGKGSLAAQIAGWFLQSVDYELRWVVPVIPEPAWTESLSDWADQHQVELVSSGDYHDLAAQLDGGRLDLAFSVFYDKIIDAQFISCCDRILNLHNGPLPRYRGVAPINWALKNGEVTHGVTIHEITPGIDDGPIVGQVCYSIYPDLDEVRDVYERSLQYGWTLFRLTAPRLDQIVPQPQDGSLATYYSTQNMQDLGERRDWTRPRP